MGSQLKIMECVLKRIIDEADKNFKWKNEVDLKKKKKKVDKQRWTLNAVFSPFPAYLSELKSSYGS